MLVTMGAKVSERCAQLFASDRYTDYLMLHGLGVEMAEALAEMWHKRIREELGSPSKTVPRSPGSFASNTRGATRGATRLPRPHGQRQSRRTTRREPYRGQCL